MMLNTPLKNKKFSINSMTMASFANSNGYINEEKNTNRKSHIVRTWWYRLPLLLSGFWA